MRPGCAQRFVSCSSEVGATPRMSLRNLPIAMLLCARSCAPRAAAFPCSSSAASAGGGVAILRRTCYVCASVAIACSLLDRWSVLQCSPGGRRSGTAGPWKQCARIGPFSLRCVWRRRQPRLAALPRRRQDSLHARPAHAPLEREVLLRCPTWAPSGRRPKVINELLTEKCGLTRAPANWRETLVRELSKFGYTKSVYDPCAFLLFGDEPLEGFVIMEIDDLLNAGSSIHQACMDESQEKFTFGK